MSASIFGGLIVAAVAIAIGVSYLRLFFSLRGERVITCPETLQLVGLEIDAPLAARTALVDDPELRVSACSRWPEKRDCDQECLTQVELRPDETLMRSIVHRWYLDKECAICGRAIGDVKWHDAVPALRTMDGAYRQWEGITAVELSGLLETTVPVCWNCDQAEQFRRSRPQLVVDRADTPLRNRLIH